MAKDLSPSDMTSLHAAPEGNKHDDVNPDRNRPSEEELEDERLAQIVRTKLPSPKTPSSTDRALMLRYINSEPSLSTFRKSDLERFLANVGVMPDGRVICTLRSRLDKLFMLPRLWGSQFGMCLRLLVRTPTMPGQAVFIPGQFPFEALISNRLIFASYRMGNLQEINEFNLSSSPEARSAFRELIARCAALQAKIIHDDLYSYNSDLISANSVSERWFSAHWTRLEWLQRGWINAYGERHAFTARLVKRQIHDLLFLSQLPELHRS